MTAVLDHHASLRQCCIGAMPLQRATNVPSLVTLDDRDLTAVLDRWMPGLNLDRRIPCHSKRTELWFSRYTDHIGHLRVVIDTSSGATETWIAESSRHMWDNLVGTLSMWAALGYPSPQI